MQAVQLFEPGDIQRVDMPDPTPQPGEIVVAVEAAGICGTDRHLFKGEFPSVPGKVLGHEFSGLIVDAGDTTFKAGQRVTCDPNIWCGTCDQCRRGRVNLCPNNLAIGIGRDGGFATYCAFPGKQAHLLPNDLDPLAGAFCEPLACTLHGIDIGAPQPGERVLVIGGGVIGLLAVQLAVLAGAEVMLLTRTPSKQELAQRFGAAHALATTEDAMATWPNGADLVLECAGVPDTVEMAPGLTRAGGRIVILGVLASGANVRIEPFDLLFREIDLRFSFLNPFTHARATQMIAAGQIDVAPLISRRIRLSEVPDIVRNVAGRGEIRAVVCADE